MTYWEGQGSVTTEAVADLRLWVIRELRRQVVRKIPADAQGVRRYRFRPDRVRFPDQFTLHIIIGDGSDARKRADRLRQQRYFPA